MNINASIRFNNDVTIRAVYNEKSNEWLYAAVNIIKSLKNRKDQENTLIYLRKGTYMRKINNLNYE